MLNSYSWLLSCTACLLKPVPPGFWLLHHIVFVPSLIQSLVSSTRASVMLMSCVFSGPVPVDQCHHCIELPAPLLSETAPHGPSLSRTDPHGPLLFHTLLFISPYSPLFPTSSSHTVLILFSAFSIPSFIAAGYSSLQHPPPPLLFSSLCQHALWESPSNPDHVTSMSSDLPGTTRF